MAFDKLGNESDAKRGRMEGVPSGKSCFLTWEQLFHCGKIHCNLVSKKFKIVFTHYFCVYTQLYQIIIFLSMVYNNYTK